MEDPLPAETTLAVLWYGAELNPGHTLPSVKKSSVEKLTGKPGTKIEILKSVTGCVKSGQVLAIIGPSGAGKTTLLDALAVRMPAEDPSKIRLNGETLTKEAFRKHCSYMPQDDRQVEARRSRGRAVRRTPPSSPRGSRFLLRT